MKEKRSIWTTITGGVTSTAPILLACCKSGACVGVCASPIASLFGVSSATIAGSPLLNAIEPLLIAISAVSFTISYYSLYVLPKLRCNTGDCCTPGDREKRKTKTRKIIFWVGLVLSISVLTYFEYSKYASATTKQQDLPTTEESSCSGSGECTESGCE